jgi:hypothetical protein
VINVLHHPVTQRTRQFVRLCVFVCAVAIAVTAVTVVTVDVGPSLRKLAEDQGSNYLKRRIHIGRLSVHLWTGSFIIEDFTIDGLTPQSRPFLVTKRISVSMPWSALVRREIVFDSIEMTDWRMYVEVLPGGKHNFPKFVPDGPRGRSGWTTTLQYVRASRGEFTFEDHGAPWSTVARNLEVIVARPSSEYRGQARFSNGTIQIQNFEPMRADMTSSFKIDGGNVLFDKIDLQSDGAHSVLTGGVDLGNFPEMTYRVRSHVNFPRMREVFFAHDAFSLSGEGDFTGTWHLFKGGRLLTGTWTTRVLGVNDYRFPNLRGALEWVPERFEVSDATGELFGGKARFSFKMAPLGVAGMSAKATFDARYEDVRLTAYTEFLHLRGLRLDGRASGQNLLEWPVGRFSDRRGSGTLTVDAPDGEHLLTRDVPAEAIALGDREAELIGPFSKHTPVDPVPVGGTVAYSFGPDWVNVAPSHVATSSTWVEFQGRTAWGAQSQIPFHVSSSDWQASDRLLAGILTALGSPTGAIEIGGHGTFDGVMTESFAKPRIEGDFSGDGMRAWHVRWGHAEGHVVIENNYADVKDVSIRSPDASIFVDGKFTIGYPRSDGGEEINARIRVIRRPASDLRTAFSLYEYPVEGLLSGEFHVFGEYAHPFGFGLMSIEDGVAYREPFDLATASLRFEGSGVRLDSVEIRKGQGRGVGAAFVGFDGTYSFNLDGRQIPVEEVAVAKRVGAVPLTGVLDFSANGRGAFVTPSYDVKAAVNDFFVGDEGIGRVSGEVSLRNGAMTVKLEAASPRLAVSGAGRIELGETANADISLQVSNTSLDPYVRAFRPAFSPFTTAIASGRLHIVGDVFDRARLRVDGEVDALDLSLFDYRLRNAKPILLVLDGDQMRVTQMHLAGEDTELDLTGVVNTSTEQVTARANGTANLGILQGFVRDLRGSGRAALSATISGSVTNPVVDGAMTIENGRIRHFALPHALEALTGTVQFDSRGIGLNGLKARVGGGDVVFAGRIGMEAYHPSAIDVSMTGRNMRLRFPEGMNSLVDADLVVSGTAEAAVLGGTVLVRSAIYKRAFDTTSGIFDLTGGTASGGGAVGPRQPTLPLRYDVRISAPSTLRIDNNTARITASTELQLAGSFDKPLVFGRVDIERGNFTFEAKRYIVTRGTIDFNNPSRIQPFFDVEAQTRIRVPGQTYNVTVSAVGTADRLTPQFTSDPPLPEVEAIALVLGDVAPSQDVEVGKYSTVITPQQQLLRERATRALTGTLSSQVDRAVEQTFGVDTFQLTPSIGDLNQQSSRLTPGARITIGKRISDRVYLTFSRSLVSTTRDQIILLEYDQSDLFSWVLSQNEDNTYALDLRMRHVF